jgi:tripartite-type tricarboxylate transporter receptor subunit TctC
MLNALAVIGDRRSNQLPEIKITAEYGYPYLAIPAFFGMFVPKGTPRTIVNKIDAAAQAALRDSKVQQQLEKASYLAKALGPDQFRTFLTDSSARWTKIIKDTDI